MAQTQTLKSIPAKDGSHLSSIIGQNEANILRNWITLQLSSRTLRSDLMNEETLKVQSQKFLSAFAVAIRAGTDVKSADWETVKEYVADISAQRARQGFSPSETATFVLSLKQPLFTVLQEDMDDDATGVAKALWSLTVALDELALYSTEVHQKSREDIINRQQQDMLELSTPVVQLWEGVLALPLIGTLDSARTQVVMETLLQEIVSTGAAIAIIDITGVPTVDTLVAQHLLKTVAAARLMGADCIISGIRPQIAQTIVHLGVELNDVITKSTLADAFTIALQRINCAVVKLDKSA